MQQDEDLNNSKYLKGTKIWINNDIAKKAQRERKALVEQRNEAKQKGYIAYTLCDAKVRNLDAGAFIISFRKKLY